MSAMGSSMGGDYDVRLVLLAVLICLIGSVATVQLFRRILPASGPSRIGWITLAAVGTGTMVWSTHFIAMLAFRPGAPVELHFNLTLGSLLSIILLAALGLTVASRATIAGGLAGGAVIGAAIAVMHYLGMAAYEVHAVVQWNLVWVVVSVVLSIALAGAAFAVMAIRLRGSNAVAASILALAVVTLHFTGMQAMSIVAATGKGTGLSDPAQGVLASTTAVAALLVVGCAAVSALIDGHTQYESYRRLQSMALRDGLTGLPNRTAFAEDLARFLQPGSSGPLIAVVMLDLSRFKAINDTHGHIAGDQVLVVLSARFDSIRRPGECIARLGGDEFACVVAYDRDSELDDFLRRIQTVFQEPFRFERYQASIHANIGVARAATDGWDADSLLLKADLAMYRAKAAFSALPCFYDAAMDDQVRARRDMIRDLHDAVTLGAFQLEFQVQASIATGSIIGYEALVRWRHPVLGLVPPSVFIPLAEETGQIVPLGIWVLRTACFAAAGWERPDVICVNLSPRQLADPELLDTIHSVLIETGLPPFRLCLELTESAIIHDRSQALRQLNALKAMGITIALDDFGVGYSSLDVLRAFRFDCIKLDRSFVAEIETDQQAVLILRGVVALAAMLDMPVLAEGIEDREQLAVVAREGCASLQGFLIGRPDVVLANPEQVRRRVMWQPVIADPQPA